MLTQKNRQMGIVKSPLAQDVLVAWKFRGREELGRPFRYELEMLSEHPEVDFDSMIGRDITVRLDIAGCPPRHFNGFVSGFEQEGKVGRLNVYRATLEPCTWFMTRRRTCRVFQDRTVLEILADVCAAAPEVRYRILAPGPRTYYPRKYCIQYGESDFRFLSRLLEEEGIYYYFEHDANGHCMVLCDGNSIHEPYFPAQFADLNVVHFRKNYNNARAWKTRGESRPEVYRHRDFDFGVPARAIEAVRQVNGPGAEVYEYPGRFSNEVFTYPGAPGDSTTFNEHDAARELAIARGEEMLTLSRVISAETVAARGIGAGSIFVMDDHPRADQNGQYLTLGIDFEIEADDYQGTPTAPAGRRSSSSTTEDLRFEFVCRFTAIPADRPFRPARITPRPAVPGPQTATVMGPTRLPSDPTGERPDVYADQFGRVKVRFHWDLEQYDDERHSCWIRVAQPWAGSGFGALFTPRVGQEVVVVFLDGDLDRPLIVGSVYNADNLPPYAPSLEPGKSTIKSRTSGAGSGGNELRFDDSRGDQQLYVHAERYEDHIVESESCSAVGGRRHLRTGGDRRENVDENHHETVARASRIKTGEDFIDTVGQNRKELTEADSDRVIGNDSREAVSNDRHEVVGRDHVEQVVANRNVTVGTADVVKVGPGGKYLTVEGPGSEIFRNAHYHEVASQYFLAAGQVVIESASGVSIKTGDSSVLVDSGGVHVKGSKVNLNCGGGAPLSGYPVPAQTPTEPLVAEPGPEPWPAKTAASDHIVGPELIVESVTRSLYSGSSIDFGNIACGKSAVRLLKLFNIGDQDLEITGVLIDGTESADFSASLNPGPSSPLTVPPDSCAEMVLSFTPGEDGARAADIHIAYQGLGGSGPAVVPSLQAMSYDIGLGGTGSAPLIAVSECGSQLAPGSALQFAVTPTVGMGTFPKKLEIRNTGSALLSVTGIELSEVPGVTATVNPTIFKLRPGSTKEVVIDLECTSTSDQTPTLSITSNCWENPSFAAQLSVSGTRLSVEQGKCNWYRERAGRLIPISTFEAQQILAGGLSPSFMNETLVQTGGEPIMPEGGDFDCGAVKVGQSGSSYFTIHNTGDAQILLQGITLAGQHSGDFQLSPDFTQSPGGLPLDPQRCQDVQVTFSPAASGPRSAVAMIRTSGGADDFATIFLQGEGLAPKIAVSYGGSELNAGDEADLGIVSCGTEVERSFAVTNNGTEVLEVRSVSLTSGTADTLRVKTSLPLRIAPGASKELGIGVQAADRGAASGTVQIVSNAEGVATFGLSFKCLRTYLEFQLQSGKVQNRTVSAGGRLETGDVLDFGGVELEGQASASLTIVNRGGADSTISDIDVVGDHDRDYSLGGISSSSVTVAAGASQAMTINFAPGGLWARAAVVNFSLDDYAENTAFGLGLRGTGNRPPSAS